MQRKPAVAAAVGTVLMLVLTSCATTTDNQAACDVLTGIVGKVAQGGADPADQHEIMADELDKASVRADGDLRTHLEAAAGAAAEVRDNYVDSGELQDGTVAFRQMNDRIDKAYAICEQ